MIASLPFSGARRGGRCSNALASRRRRNDAASGRRGAWIAAVLAFGLGCGGDAADAEALAGAGGGGVSSGATSPCGHGFLGDPAGEPTVHVRALDPDMAQLLAVDDGGAMPLSTPPQGGRVIFTALRATNLVPCGVSVVATLRDPATGASRSDARTINLEPVGDGWGQSIADDLGTVAHLPVCPNLWSDRDVFDEPYALTVTLTDPDGREATRTVTVTPGCVEGGALDDECRCICAAGYRIGAPCP